MSNNGDDMRRESVRHYLLGTLDAEEHRVVGERIASDPAWAEAAQAAEAELARLGLLPEVEPPSALAARTVSALRHGPSRSTRNWTSKQLVMAPAAVALIVVLGFVLLEVLAGGRSAREAALKSNFAHFALAAKMYSNESPGERWPPAVRTDGGWVPDLRALYPKYLAQPDRLLDPTKATRSEVAALEQAFASDPPDWDLAHRTLARHIVYTGFVMKEAEDLSVVRSLAQRSPRHEDIKVDETSVRRLREGIERFLITDINNPMASAQQQSDVPVMVQNVFTDDADFPQGAMALYMDGSVRYVSFEEDPDWFDALAELLAE